MSVEKANSFIFEEEGSVKCRSRRAWKQSQSVGRPQAVPPAPATMPSSRKRKRSPSPQSEPEAPSTSKRDSRGRISKIVEEPEPEDEDEVPQTEVSARPSRNHRKSAKILKIEREEESASTASEKEPETPTSTGRRKSGQVDKGKDAETKKGKETETKKEKKEEVVAPLTLVMSKGEKGKMSICIKPIPEPVEDKVAEAVPEEPVKESRSSRKKKKSGKQDVAPLLPLEIPSDSNITVKEDQESGIKLKLILSPKDRTQAEVAPEVPSSTEEKKKNKKDRGKKGKGKGKIKETPPPLKEDKLKAKLVFKDQVLSLDGDKVTHTEKTKSSDEKEIERSKSGSRSKKRKHDEIESPVVEEQVGKRKKGKVAEPEVVSPSEVETPKTDKKSKKKKNAKDVVETPPAVESPSTSEIPDAPTSSKSSKSKSLKDKHKDKVKGHKDVKGDKEDVKSPKEDGKSDNVEKKDKKSDVENEKKSDYVGKDKKKKKDKKPKEKIEVSTPSRRDHDLDTSHLSLDSFKDTDTSLVIDESPEGSRGHSSKKKKARDLEKKESSKESSEGEKRKEKSKHKHHRHDKHHHHSDKKSKHKKHRPGTGNHITITNSPNTSDQSFSDLSTINASALGFAGTSPPVADGSSQEKKKASSSSGSTKPKKAKESRDRKESSKRKDKEEEKVKEKKPLSAYVLWCKQTRPRVVAQNPDADFSAISKLMGIKWHQLSDKDKAYWQNMQRKQVIKHKNIPTLSANKMSSKRSPGQSGRSKPKSPSRLPPPNMEAIDIAAHLRLLGESLSTVGRRLQEHKDEIEIHGSVSMLLDSTLCALGPLMALTSQVPEINGCSRETHVTDNSNAQKLKNHIILREHSYSSGHQELSPTASASGSKDNWDTNSPVSIHRVPSSVSLTLPEVQSGAATALAYANLYRGKNDGDEKVVTSNHNEGAIRNGLPESPKSNSRSYTELQPRKASSPPCSRNQLITMHHQDLKSKYLHSPTQGGAGSLSPHHAKANEGRSSPWSPVASASPGGTKRKSQGGKVGDNVGGKAQRMVGRERMSKSEQLRLVQELMDNFLPLEKVVTYQWQGYLQSYGEQTYSNQPRYKDPAHLTAFLKTHVEEVFYQIRKFAVNLPGFEELSQTRKDSLLHCTAPSIITTCLLQSECAHVMETNMRIGAWLA